MDTIELQTIWNQILSKTEQTLNKEICDYWLKPLMPLNLTDRDLTLASSTNFARERIQTRYLPLIEDAASEVVGREIKITLEVIDLPPLDAESEAIFVKEAPAVYEASPKKQSIQTSLLDEEMMDTGENKAIKPASLESSFSLNPKYVFETFVTGNSNRLAHAAAMAVAEAPAEKYNPFFVYGGVGLGKTHLMHAIGNRILKNFPDLRVLYISSEKFTNELINSIRDSNPEQFRQKYRNIDVLLVDDIQFLSNKERTQEEFFHTFNTLHDAKKQIIISSDRPPREIKTLEDRLRSRFEWGLITDIQAPDLETRIAILRKKALLDNINVPNDVMVYIASRIDSNIRELEGALLRVMATASLTGRTVNNELAAEALKDLYPSSRAKQITLELIQEIVASYFKIKVDELLSKKRTRNLAFPRQIAMYLCRELTDTSLPRIGEMFGGRDHTTVIHAYDKIVREKNEDAKLNNTIKELIKRIENM
jgi:chromosomal replication initiator protein